MSIAGNLRTMPFADLVQWLSSAMKTGTLVIDGTRYTKRIILRRGTLVTVSSDNPREMLGYYLVGWGYLTEDELQYLIEMQAHCRVMLGELVVQMGHLTRDDLAAVMRVKTEESLYDLMTWEEANFRFLDGELPERDFIELEIPVQRILLEGHRQRDERALFARRIPSAACVPVPLHQPLPTPPGEVGQAVVEQLDGERTIEEIALAARVPDFAVMRVVFVGLEGGWLRLETPTEIRRATPGWSHAPWNDALRDVEDRIDRDRLLDAYNLLSAAREKWGSEPEARRAFSATEGRLVERLDTSAISGRVILEPTARLDELLNLDCAPAEGFVLSRINGFYSVQEVLSQLPGGDLQNRIILHNLLRRGLAKIREERSVRRWKVPEGGGEPFEVGADDEPFEL